MTQKEIIELIAQIIGIFAMSFNITAYQFKSRRNILCFQLTGASLFAVNMFMLDAMVGGVLNIVAVIRAIVYMNKEKIKLPTALLNGIFISLYITSYILSFTVFGKEYNVRNAIIELLPVVGMTATTFGLGKGTSKAIRICALMATSPCWLIYNCFNLSIGGILCESFSIISSTTALIRIDIKRKRPKESTDSTEEGS